MSLGSGVYIDYEYPRRESPIECGDCLAKMQVFVGTNCLICPICKELRWLL